MSVSERSIAEAEDEARSRLEWLLEGAEEVLNNLAGKTDTHPEDRTRYRRQLNADLVDTIPELLRLPEGDPAWASIRTALWIGLWSGLWQSEPAIYHAERKLRLAREAQGATNG